MAEDYQNSTVVCTEGICGGSPCVRGTRLTVHDVGQKVLIEKDMATVYEDYALSREQILECLQYCSRLCCVVDARRVEYCGNCILAGLPFDINKCELREEFLFTADPALLGPFVDSHMLEKPYAVGWLMAREALDKLGELHRDAGGF